jgi:hypothetical protein
MPGVSLPRIGAANDQLFDCLSGSTIGRTADLGAPKPYQGAN